MKIKMNYFFPIAMLMGSLLSGSAYAQTDMDQKDPARWQMEDTTPKAHYQTLVKEANAAYRENQTQCKKMTGTEKRTCLKDAKEAYQHDMADAKSTLKK